MESAGPSETSVCIYKFTRLHKPINHNPDLCGNPLKEQDGAGKSSPPHGYPHPPPRPQVLAAASVVTRSQESHGKLG